MLDWPSYRVPACACLALILGMAATGTATAAPRVTSVKLDRPAVTGSEARLRFRAVDPNAPVSGLVVTFGGPSDVVGTSACRPPDSRGRPPGGAFAGGAPVTLRASRTFRSAGPHPVVARLDSGGCAPGKSVFQPLTVTATRPGDPPKPLVVGTPVTVPDLLPKGPVLPGIELPGLPALLSTASPDSALAAAAAGCRDANRRVGTSRRSRRRARGALVCLMNAYRRGRRLSGLRQNGRLLKAASGHSKAMVSRGFFSHVGPGGVVLTTRLTRARYLPARSWRVGENLAFLGGSPARVLNAWLASPPHYANIVHGGFREIGLGVAAGTPRGSRRRGATYTAVFGARR